MFLIVILLLCLFTIFALYFVYLKRNSNKFLEQIPGPRPKYPFVGNIDLFSIKDVPRNVAFSRIVSAFAKIYEQQGLFKLSLGPITTVVIFGHDKIKSFLETNENITKARQYQYLKDWLGQGLLISAGSHWKKRRRMLAPAFHTNILNDFIPIMSEQADILVENLRKEIKHQWVDIRGLMSMCTLDVICETAMGVSIGAQSGKNQDYLNAIATMGQIMMYRSNSPWLWPSLIFYLTPIGKKFKTSLNILHSMTKSVIIQRKAEILCRKTDVINNDVISGSKKRMAFLDLLLEYHIRDNSMSLEDISEEVDTFMFAGHDTTAVSLSWILYLLGLHPEIQFRIQEELDTIFGKNKDRDITSYDIKQMDYLECVIKESLRLFPSVPLIGRQLIEDMNCGQYVIPKGTTVFLLLEKLQTNSEFFPDPLKFNPDRFMGNTILNANAYKYIPFSSGPRSCIGKGFALIEEKVILTKIFLNFNLRSLDPRDKIKTTSEMVYRAISPLRVQIIARESFHFKTNHNI